MGRTYNDSVLRYQRSQKLFNYLYNVNVATSKQLARVVNGKMEIDYAKQNAGQKVTYSEPSIIRQMVKDKMINTYTPYLGPTLYAAANGTDVLTTYDDAETRSLQNLTTNVQQHNVAISSIISQVFAAPEYDALGLGFDEWGKYRAAILNDDFQFIGESRIMKSWALNKSIVNNSHNNWDSRSTEYSKMTKDKSQAAAAWRAMFESNETGSDLFNLTLDFNGAIIDKEDCYAGKGGFTSNLDKTRIQMHDYRPDGVMLFKNILDPKNDDEDHKTNVSIAVEVELTAKSVDNYIGKLAAYQSVLGRNVYKYVIYYCTRRRTANRINAALNYLSNNTESNFNLKNQIHVVMMNGDNARLAQGADMQIDNYVNLNFVKLDDLNDDTTTAAFHNISLTESIKTHDYPYVFTRKVYTRDTPDRKVIMKKARDVKKEVEKQDRRNERYKEKYAESLRLIHIYEDLIRNMNPNFSVQTPQQLINYYGANGIGTYKPVPENIINSKKGDGKSSASPSSFLDF